MWDGHDAAAGDVLDAASDLLGAWGRGPRGAQGGNLCGVGGILSARGSDGILSTTSIMSVFTKFTV
jgi:hypothetical protein